MSKTQTAIVIGATGLVGNQLVKQLIADSNYNIVKIFGRRPSGFEDAKLQEFIVDFAQSETYAEFLQGDVLFSCLGTTIKKAGTKAAQYQVDFTFQYEFAKKAFEQGIKKYALVSSSNANAKSSIFYSRIKGELDEAVINMGFEKCIIMRPSILLGERNEKRASEEFAAKVMQRMTNLLPFMRKYRGIQGYEVAEAMRNAIDSSNNKAVDIYSWDEIFGLIQNQS
jgi:uncharacterized protein YbjT (DUF2867 family)